MNAEKAQVARFSPWRSVPFQVSTSQLQIWPKSHALGSRSIHQSRRSRCLFAKETLSFWDNCLSRVCWRARIFRWRSPSVKSRAMMAET